jgi:N6-L-threonylcarbamoyladenine synthase
MASPHIVLAVETSCDETSLAVVEFHSEFVRVLAHKVESQIAIHQPFGGVVPEVAARDHLAKIHTLANLTLQDAGISINKCHSLAVTLGPGLIGPLMVGVLYARGISLATGLPLRGVNHVDAHLAPCFFMESFSPQADLKKEIPTPNTLFPALALTVSGGHCILSHLESPTHRMVLGHTADDACGEAFDKVAKLLGLPYPGGPEIEALARKAAPRNPGLFRFPHDLADKSNTFGFSFSGLKTAALDAVRRQTQHKIGKISGSHLPIEVKADIARSFQEAAIGQLLSRLKNALKAAHLRHEPYRQVLVAGGVAANLHFRAQVEEVCQGQIPYRFAPLSLCSDNATMIALQSRWVWADGKTQHPFPRYAIWQESARQNPL